MKNSLFSKFRTTLKNIPAMRILVIASFLFFSSQLDLLLAQGPKLSIQGILKKSSGEAVTDGNYDLTFKLWTAATGGSQVWTETQMGLDVISGIYSTVLGNSSPLNISFNQLYYLGVTVGSSGTEMTPRVQLTSAPYALSLIGNTNQFPSSGMVLADTLNVKTNVLARFGAPGANGVNKNGYAFNGANGDKDSGLFSTGLGQASLYSNNVKMLTVTPDSVAIRSDVRLSNDANINYNGLDDWRLVYQDNFGSANNSLGWQVYNNTAGEYIGWNNGTAAGNAPVSGDATKFVGRYLYPTLNTQVLKKAYNLSGVGTYSYIKVKFKYYFIDSWNGPGYDEGNHDVGWAAFAETNTGTQFRMGWWESRYAMDGYVGEFNANNGLFINANKWEGNSTNSEYTENAEMTAYKNSNSDTFWLMFGSTLNNTHADESYGVGMIEIWVK